MNIQTVAFTAENGLCCSCGVCKGLCPRDAISWQFREGMYIPEIRTEQCVSCGLCAQVCPGLQMEYPPADTPEQAMEGPVLECFNAWSRDEQKRHCSSSGGVLSTLIPALLEQGRYDGVFCLDSYDYRQQLQSVLMTAGDFSGSWAENKSPRSRYLPVSHQEAVACIRSHPEKRLILVGTSCAIRGLAGAIDRLHRDRENYLLIGLFCDQVFSYNLLEYYRQDGFCGGKTLTELHFKNKESGGWPGNMKFHFSDGSSCYHDQSNRADMKPYFMPERCLYCIDKLNIRADISLGDNYTGTDESPLGSNSVILRTGRGQLAWQAVCEKLELRPLSIGQIRDAQALSRRAVNAGYAVHKARALEGKCDLNPGICPGKTVPTRDEYRKKLAQLGAGRVYPQEPRALARQRKLARRIPLKRRVRQVLGRCWRKLRCRQ